MKQPIIRHSLKYCLILSLGILTCKFGCSATYFLVGNATAGANSESGSMWSITGSGGPPVGVSINWSTTDIMVIDEYSNNTYGSPIIYFTKTQSIASILISGNQIVTFYGLDSTGLLVNILLSLHSPGVPLSIGAGSSLLFTDQYNDYQTPFQLRIGAGTGNIDGILGSGYYGTTLNIMAGATINATGFIYGVNPTSRFSSIFLDGNLIATNYVNASNFSILNNGYFKTSYSGTKGWWNGNASPTIVSIEGTVEYSGDNAQVIAGAQHRHLILSGTTTSSKTKKTISSITVTGKLTIGEFNNLDLNNLLLTCNGDIENNGTIINSSVANRGGLRFSGSSLQTYYGTGTTNFDTLIIFSSYAGNVFLNSAIPMNVNSVIFQNICGINNSNVNIRIGKGGLSSSSITYQGTTSKSVGTFTGVPDFNIGSGGLTINYKTESTQRTTGVEMPASLKNVNIFNPKGIILNTDVSLSGAFTVRNGGTNLIGMLDARDKVVSGSGNFIVENGSTIKTSHPGGLNGSNATSGGSSSFSNTANYHFYGIGSQTTGSYLPSTVGSITLSGTSDLTLSNTSLSVTNGCTINPDTRLNINSNQVITVSGVLTNTSGINGLLLKSDATGTGSLIESTGNISGKVQRHIDNGGDYHFFTMPVSSALTFDDVFPEPTWNNMQIWVREYNETLAEWVEKNHSQSLVPGKGYTTFVDEQPTGAPIALFSGTLGSGNVQVQLSYTEGKGEGYNLIGNPYPSAIDWDLVSKTNVDPVCYVWNNSGNYITWNGSVGDLTGGLIPASQGFFAHANSNNASVTFTNNARVHSNNNFWKSSATSDRLLSIKVTSPSNPKRDKVFIKFNPEASSGFDSQFDVCKLHGDADAPEIYTSGDQILSTSVLKSIDDTPVIPLVFKAGKDAFYTFTAEGMESFLINEPIWLEDQSTGMKMNLKDNPVYHFSSLQGTFENRFKIHFSQVGIEETKDMVLNAYATGNILHVSVPEGCNGSIMVYNTFGQMVANTHAGSGGIYDIPVNSPAGTYLVQFRSTQYQLISKVITR